MYWQLNKIPTFTFVKFTNFILSIIFLLLSCLPCADQEQIPSFEKVTVNNNTTVDHAGSGSAGGNVKLDHAGSGSAGGNVKLDHAGSGSAGGNVKLD